MDTSLCIPRFDCFVKRCPKSSCTLCTLRLLRSDRLAPGTAHDNKRGALMRTMLKEDLQERYPEEFTGKYV
ncbi:MAG: hypothetical protein C1941_09015 [Prosthecochloris sp.]|nr:hypothetical protein [Prosthecochloris sp.]